jgi:hypothetical protein
MAQSNPRYDCTGCKMRNTRNQLKASNGICLYCKTPMPNAAWMGGQQGTLSQLLAIPRSDEQSLLEISKESGLTVADIMSAAIQIQLQKWLLDPENIVKAIKDDLMVAKLYRR